MYEIESIFLNYALCVCVCVYIYIYIVEILALQAT